MLFLPFLAEEVLVEVPEEVGFFDVPENVLGVGIAALVLIIYLFSVAIYISYKKQKAKKYTVSGNIFSEEHKTKTSKRGIYSFYKALDKIPFIRPYIRDLEYKLMPLYPTDEGMANKSFTKPLVKILLLNIGAGVASFFFVWGLQPSVYTLMAAIIITFGACDLITMMVVNSERKKFKNRLEIFLEDVGHYFSASKNIVLAIENASDRADSIMKRHAQEFIDILTSQDVSGARHIYMARNKDKYLKLFLSQAELVAENGNTVDDHGSIFLTSIAHMRSTIGEERREDTEKQFAFASFGWICILPCAAQPYIANWGTYTMATMQRFYIGRLGNILKLVILLLTVVCFQVIKTLQASDDSIRENKLLTWISKRRIIKRIIDTIADPDSKKVFYIKETMKRSGDHNVYRSYYVRKMLCGIFALIVVFVLMNTGHKENKEYYLYDSTSLEDISQSADSKQVAALMEIVPRYVQEYVELDERPTLEEVQERVILEKGIRTKEVAADAAKQIVNRLEKYDREVFDYTDVLVVVLLTIVGYCYPMLIFFLRRRIVADRMRAEVVSFENLVNMMRNVPGMQPVTMLEAMEDFAVAFKDPLRTCVNNFASDSEEALETLLEAEKNEEFRKIVRNFQRVDDTGVSLAFEETAISIKNYNEDRKVERVIQLKKETEIAMMAALAPGAFLLFGYLLGPFLICSLEGFGAFQEQLNDMSS